jgi:CubicO group peptidase (beta-lactamase class C family)
MNFVKNYLNKIKNNRKIIKWEKVKMNKVQLKSSRIILLATLTIFLLSSTQSIAQDKASKIDELMTKIVENKQFNGSVLVAEDGKVIYKKGFGYANMDWKIPNTPDTKFRIGSITKQFVAPTF